MENKKVSSAFIFKTIISFIIFILLSFPWFKFNVTWPSYMFGGKVIIELNYIISLVFLIIYLFMCFFNDNNSLNNVSNKVLIDGILIALAYNHSISILLPIIVVVKDIFVLYLKGKVTSIDKVSNIIMFIGIILVLLGNIPFEFLNLAVDQGLIILASCMSIYSGIINMFININKLKEDN